MVALALISMRLAAAVVFNCTFGTTASSFTRDGFIIGATYRCTGTVVASGDPNILTGVTGTHVSGYNNSLVTYLVVSLQTVQVTKNIERFFPNLKHINFEASPVLSVLSPDDLKPFPDLVSFDPSSNKVVEIDSDLFYYNPLLKFVCFNGNAHERVGLGLLSNLTLLEHAHFDGGKCSPGYAYRAVNSSAVPGVIDLLSQSCPASTRMTERVINRMQKRIGSGGNSMDEQRVVEIVLEKTEELRSDVEVLARVNADYKARIIDLEMAVRELTAHPCTCNLPPTTTATPTDETTDPVTTPRETTWSDTTTLLYPTTQH